MIPTAASSAVQQPPLRRRPSRWLIAAIAFVIAVVAVFVVHLDSDPAARRDAPASPSAGVYPGEEAMSGNELLAAIADRVAVLPADPPTGTYEHLHSVVWGTEIQGPIRAVDQETWHLPDGAARYAIQRARNLPAQGFDPATASLDFTGPDISVLIQESTDVYLTELPDIKMLDWVNPEGQLYWYLSVLRRTPTASADVHIQELVNIYHQQIVIPLLRTAILRLLAGYGSFTHERVTDPLRRTGIAFTISIDPGRQTTLIIDPATGALNAVHETFHGRLFAYHLFYESQWDDHRGPQTPQPTPVSTVAPTQTIWPSRISARPTPPTNAVAAPGGPL